MKTRINSNFAEACWKEQPFTFTVYFMNHVFQASVLMIRDNRMYNKAYYVNISEGSEAANQPSL